MSNLPESSTASIEPIAWLTCSPDEATAKSGTLGPAKTAVPGLRFAASGLHRSAMDAPSLATRPEAVAPDAHGLYFYLIDRSLRDLLGLHLEPALRVHLEPHLVQLGERLSTDLDELARTADRHTPVLHPRDRHGRDAPWIEYHPAYRALEAAGFGEFGLAALSHRGGVLGWPQPLPPIVKYALTYLL